VDLVEELILVRGLRCDIAECVLIVLWLANVTQKVQMFLILAAEIFHIVYCSVLSPLFLIIALIEFTSLVLEYLGK
jgi:hypothetical protein